MSKLEKRITDLIYSLALIFVVISIPAVVYFDPGIETAGVATGEVRACISAAWLTISLVSFASMKTIDRRNDYDKRKEYLSETAHD